MELGVLEDQLVEHILSLATVESVQASYKEVVTGNSIPDLPIDEPISGNLEGSPLEGADDDGPEESNPDATAGEREGKPPRKGRLRRWLGGGRS